MENAVFVVFREGHLSFGSVEILLKSVDPLQLLIRQSSSLPISTTMFALPHLSRSQTARSSLTNKSHEQNEGLINDEAPKENSGGIRTKRPQSWLTWTAAFLAIGFQALTSIYASGTVIASHLHFLYASSSSTIFVLSVLSSFTGLFLSATIASTFEKVQWMLISRQNGLRVSQYLTLQAGTGALGLLTLLLGKGLGWGSSTRGWAAVRLSAIVLGPILGVLIMSKYTLSVLDSE